MRIAGRITFFVLAGVTAGLLTWLFSAFLHFSDRTDNLTPEDATNTLYVTVAFGILVGFMLGAADTLALGVKGQWGKVAIICSTVGFSAGFFGSQLGQAFFGFLYNTHPTTPFDFLRNIFARALGWAFIGAVAGTGDGFRKVNFRVARNGFIGGFLGGMLGGTVFEIIPFLLPGSRSPGIISRLFGFVITAAMIGLFVALVQELLKEAWIRVVVGKNEGREYLIERELTKIGRDEVSDIPLFGNPAITKTHAVVLADSDGYYKIRDQSEVPQGVLVNGQEVQWERILRDGDQIQIADRLLIFHERMTRKRSQRAPRDITPPRLTLNLPQSGGLRSLHDSLPPPNPFPPSDTFPPSPPLPPLRPQHFPVDPVPFMAEDGTVQRLPRLVAVSGPFVGTVFPIAESAVIGRDITADISLVADARVSRTHARIIREATGYIIEDGGSTNGTFVNGKRITREPLVAGDTIIIGNSSFKFE